MTQAFNLAQLANNLNTSGQLDATDGLTGLVTNANLASSGTASSSTYLRGDRTWASLPQASKILQIASVTKVDTFSMTGTTYVDITGMSVSITPWYSNSKLMLVFLGSGMGNSVGGIRFTDGSGNPISPIGTPYLSNFYAAHGALPYTTDGNLEGAIVASIIETNTVGTTSSVTRKVQLRSENNNGQAINRGFNPANAPYTSPVSTLYVLEIAA